MQVSDIIRSVRRHWRWSVAILLLAGLGLGLFLVNRKVVRGSDRWSAAVQVLVPVRDKDGNLPAGVPPSLLYGQTTVALSDETTTAALKGAGLNENNRGDVTFGFSTPDASTTAGTTAPQDTLRLTVTAPDPSTATKLVGSYADAYIAQRRKSVAGGDTSSQQSARASLVALGTKLDQVTAQLRLTDPGLLAQLSASDSASPTANGSLPPIALPANTPLDTVLLAYERRTLINTIANTRQSYADSSTQSIVPGNFATVVEKTLPVQIIPALPSPLIPIAVALGLGLLLAIAVPVLIDFLDHSIRDARTAGNALSARVLSTIPASSPGSLAALARPGSARDAAYRALAATSVSTDELPRAIVVTSPVGDMQDSVAANFAVALAGLGLRVALIATDARQAWFMDSDRATNAATLPELLALSGSLNGQISDALVPTHLANLAVLAPGATEADDLLDGLPALLEGLANSGIDVTVIAAPALLEDPSATILAWSTRSVLWVIEAGEVTEPEAREAASRLALAGATPFGVAMVAAKG